MLPLLEAFRKDLYHCADCNYCVDAVWAERGIEHVCPTMQSHSPVTSYAGRGYIAAARAWIEGTPLDLAVLGDRVFTCTTCSHCETVCPIGLRPTQVGRALRGELWARDTVPAPARALHEAMRRDGNPHGVARAARTAWQAGWSPHDAQAEKVLYLPGCAAATAQPAEARAAVALIQAAGFVVETLGEQDTCCGAPLFELGLETEAALMREALAAKVAARSEIVISGLECACSWQRRLHGEVPRSVAEWLVVQIHTGRLQLVARAQAPREIHLLDSCQTRAAGPAQALHKLCELLEVKVAPAITSARHVVCCGAAGGMPQMAPESAVRMATARLHGQATSAVFVSADPRCVAHLRRATPNARIFGIAEFLHTFFTDAP